MYESVASECLLTDSGWHFKRVVCH